MLSRASAASFTSSLTSMDEYKEDEIDDDEQNHHTTLRRMVQEIRANPDLTPKQKGWQIQKIMMQRYNNTQKHSSEPPVNPSTPTSVTDNNSSECLNRTNESDSVCGDSESSELCSMRNETTYAKTFTDDSNTIFGCAHYERQCHIVAPCCDEVFTCRLCHDEKKDHTIDRYAITEMVCMHCLVRSPIGQHCNNEQCDHFEQPLARYFCSTCNFFDDDATKEIYHCADCGLCRRGQGLGIDYEHCHDCNACINTRVFSEHTCIERSLESNCPICSEFMFTSVEPVIFMACGHAMHNECFNQYLQSDYTCPICMKSIVDMTEHFEQVDSYVASFDLPEEFRGIRVSILCNDCLHKSETDYNVVYHKCVHCQSYNTKVLEKWREGNNPNTVESI